jgi:hypothetical protein
MKNTTLNGKAFEPFRNPDFIYDKKQGHSFMMME